MTSTPDRHPSGERVAVVRDGVWCPTCRAPLPLGTGGVVTGTGVDARYGYVVVTFDGHPHPSATTIAPAREPAVSHQQRRSTTTTDRRMELAAEVAEIREGLSGLQERFHALMLDVRGLPGGQLPYDRIDAYPGIRLDRDMGAGQDADGWLAEVADFLEGEEPADEGPTIGGATDEELAAHAALGGPATPRYGHEGADR